MHESLLIVTEHHAKLKLTQNMFISVALFASSFAVTLHGAYRRAKFNAIHCCVRVIFLRCCSGSGLGDVWDVGEGWHRHPPSAVINIVSFLCTRDCRSRRLETHPPWSCRTTHRNVHSYAYASVHIAFVYA